MISAATTTDSRCSSAGAGGGSCSPGRAAATLGPSWFIDEAFCDTDGGETLCGYEATDVCALAGFVVTQIDLAVAHLAFTADGFDCAIYHTFYGHVDD